MSASEASPETVRVLFVCAENAARSQMAEGLLRDRGGGRYSVYSAGTTPGGVHPMAVAVMDEIGIDLREQASEPLSAYAGVTMDYVVTLCDSTRDVSPSIRATEMVIHQPVDDPAAAAGSPEAQRAAFRRVREQLDDWVARAFCMEPA